MNQSSFKRQKRGASLTGYGLLLGLLGVAAIVAVGSIGEDLTSVFDDVSGFISGESGEAGEAGAGDDVFGPEILSLIPPPDGAYGEGGFLDFVVIFSEPVTVTGGTPEMMLEIGSNGEGQLVPLVYVPEESSETELLFRHIITAEDNDIDGVQFVSTEIVLEEGSIMGESAEADRTLPEIDTSGITIESGLAFITAVIPPPDGFYNTAADELQFTVRWSRAVERDHATAGMNQGAGNLRFEYDWNSTTYNRSAGYRDGEGTAEWVMGWSICCNAPDGLRMTSPLELNNYPLRNVGDQQPLGEIFPFDVPDISGIILDNTAPSGQIALTGEDQDHGGALDHEDRYEAGDLIVVTIAYNEPVLVDPSAQLPMTISPSSPYTVVYADYDPARSSETEVVFVYEVQSGDIGSTIRVWSSGTNPPSWASETRDLITDRAGNVSGSIGLSGTHNAYSATIYGVEANFVAVASPNMFLSVDGETWTQTALGDRTIYSNHIETLEWSNGRFWAGGPRYTFNDGRPHLIATPPDGAGLQWAFEDQLPLMQDCKTGRFVEGGGRQLVVGHGCSGVQTPHFIFYRNAPSGTWSQTQLPSGHITLDFSGFVIPYEPDPEAEDPQDEVITPTPAHLNPTVNQLAYGAGRFVAVGDSDALLSSTNGQNWSFATLEALWDNVTCNSNGSGGTSCTLTRYHYNWKTVVWTGSRFVAVGQRNNSAKFKILTSTDGQLWTETENANLTSHGAWLFDMTYAAGKLVAVGSGSDGPLILTSTDQGETWSEPLNVGALREGALQQCCNHSMRAIDYSSRIGRFVAIRNPYPVALVSTDGHTWTPHSFNFSSLSIADVAGRD